VRIRAPAKVNLYLRVLGKRRDGYHLIDTIMVPVSLFDVIEIRRLRFKGTKSANARITVSCDHPSVPRGEKNIVSRAARLLMQRVDTDQAVHIRIRKRIPIGAGLGGGSTDAAATLIGLNRLFKLRLSNGRLEKLALSLGADVPFFIRARPARAGGIGERLRPLGGMAHFWLVIIYPGFPVSTAWAYKSLPRKLTKPIVNTSIATSLQSLDKLVGLLVNDLESVTLDRYPKIRLLKKMLLREGAVSGLMAGSGSAVFGIFKSKGEAQKALHRLRYEEGVQTFLVRVLSN
jgi:4-diphosphocytidyl-2-C-methyl-D-erythritol kinase